MPSIELSLIVPTRDRPDALHRLLESLCDTANDLSRVELVLVVDDDAVPTPGVVSSLAIQMIAGPPGRSMGALNRAGCEAARGHFLMLLNDDVVARTPGWDDRLLEAARTFLDGVVLVHVNDTLMQHHLCTFPLVSRVACDLMNGICPREYLRYRIDDHIEDIFNLLGLLGERRSIYLPEVVFEHLNAVEVQHEIREYHADPTVLALDAPLFDALRPQRREIAMRLFDHIDQHRRQNWHEVLEKRLASADTAFALRQPDRLRLAPAAPILTDTRPSVTIALLNHPNPPAMPPSVDPSLLTNKVEIRIIFIQKNALARQLNALCASSASDFLVLLESGVHLPPGWLDRLLACVQPGVAVVTPTLTPRSRARTSTPTLHAGLLFAPDGSGHHGAWTSPLPGVVPTFSFCSPVVLLDRARAAQLHFDESYSRYFFDCDLGLRCWEQGWQVVTTPTVVCEVEGDTPISDGGKRDDPTFEADRQRFVEVWTTSGRFDRLRKSHWEQIPFLNDWLNLAEQCQTETSPNLSTLAALQHSPILLPYLQPRPAVVVARRGFVQRLTRCLRERGLSGLWRAFTKRLGRLLAWLAARLDSEKDYRDERR